MDMDQNLIEVLPETAVNHHNSDNNNTIDFDEAIANMLHNLELSDFDFNLHDMTLPPNIFEMPAPPESPQLSSLSVGSGDQNLIGVASVGANGCGNGGGGNVMEVCHQRNNFSVGGSSTTLSCKMKNTIPPEKLAEISNVDPKKAKRIVVNRIAAKRSKEKRKVYEKELEKRVELLQIQADNATAERVMAMNEVMYLAAGNQQIKEQIQSAIEYQEKKRAYIELLKEEARILRIQIQEQTTSIDSSFGEPPSQSQLQEVPPQPQLYIPPSLPLSHPLPSPFGQPFSDHFIGTDSSSYNPLD